MAVPKEVFVGIDVAKLRNAVAIAEAGRDGEIRYMGEFDASPEGVTRLIRKLAGRHGKLHVCYEAGPTGYGLYRQILSLGHECIVVAPSLIPRRSGDRVKTNRRDAQSLARLLRAGELTAVWGPDETHEAVRDLVRTRAMAVEDYRRTRQHLSGFMLQSLAEQAAGIESAIAPADAKSFVRPASAGAALSSCSAGITSSKTAH